MCVVIVKPKGQTVPDQVIRDCWQANPDGAGIMYAEAGEVHIEKGFMKLRKLLKWWKDIRDDLTDVAVVFHFRIGTSGNMDASMTHPFRVNPSLAISHNGILPINVPLDSAKSDTALLADHLAEQPVHLDSDWAPLEEWMGAGNKIALLGSTGGVKLLNEGGWQRKDGLIFSNLNWDWSIPPRTPRSSRLWADWEGYCLDRELEFEPYESDSASRYGECISCGCLMDRTGEDEFTCEFCLRYAHRSQLIESFRERVK